MESCAFSYYISEHGIEIEGLKCKYRFGKYTMLTDSKTPFMHACNEEIECAIFGYAVNVFTKESENLADQIISCCLEISDVIEFEKNLGGKYIIFYKNKDEYYILGDATCSIPVFYNISGEFACTGNLHCLVNQYGYRPDSKLQRIRDSGNISQAMPFDVTQYGEIKQLLPNHYLAANERKAIRFINSDQIQAALTVNEATELVAPLVETMCEFYKTRFKINCPITSGRDSRVVLAFLLANGFDGSCYTIKHPEHSDTTQDIVVPKKLCEAVGVPYSLIQDVELTPTVINQMDNLLGKGNYSMRTLRIAQTVKEFCADSAIINGDIIGQVGKCSLHRDIPQCFATPGYFRCKLHNYSRESKRQLKLWLKEIKTSGECVNTFDLFSIENRMGRWAGQTNMT